MDITDIGPSRYEPETVELRQRLNADSVILIVVGGTRGNGFSITANASVLPVISRVLRAAADKIEGILDGPMR
jgi:hypothetical protein